MNPNPILQQLTVVIRTFNNPDITSAVENYLNMGVGRIIIVVNEAQDNSVTTSSLEKFRNNPRLQFLIISENYTWCNALNRALNSILINNAAKTSAAIQYILNASVEAQFTQNHIETMLQQLHIHEDVAVVGTAFAGYQIINGESKSIHLGDSYKHPRNTGMIIALGKNFPSLYFDTRCDTLGGMEDIDFLLRMLATTDLKYKLLPLDVPLRVGVNHDQQAKEKREQAAIKQIVSDWLSWFPADTPQATRIRSSIESMGLKQHDFPA